MSKSSAMGFSGVIGLGMTVGLHCLSRSASSTTCQFDHVSPSNLLIVLSAS